MDNTSVYHPGPLTSVVPYLDRGTRRNSQPHVILHFIALVVALTLSTVATARVLVSKGPVEQHGLNGLLLGSGLEYTPDPLNPEYVIPYIIEYDLTEQLKLGTEVDYKHISCTSVAKRESPGDCGGGAGVSDAELSAEWKVINERRWQPSVALLGIVKFPTNALLGSNFADYDVGLIINKEFVFFTVDLDAVYTFVGTPRGQPADHNWELSTSIENDINPVWVFMAEFVWDSNGGGAGHQGSGNSTPGSQTIFTVGFAQHITKELRLEEGYSRQSDGTKQVLFGVEYAFGGGRR